MQARDFRGGSSGCAMHTRGRGISEVMVRRAGTGLSEIQWWPVCMAEREAAADGATIRRTYPLPGYCLPR
jgi:hypothetical protein